MRRLASITLLLAGCAPTSITPAALPSPSPAAPAVAPAPIASGSASLPPYAAAAAVIPASMPFRTAYAGTYFEPGAGEQRVLNTQAELDAFLASRPRALPIVTPPVEAIDFTRERAVAYIDGGAPAVSHSRIAALADGDVLRVIPARWVAPGVVDPGASAAGNLHVITLARSDKPIVFDDPLVIDATWNDPMLPGPTLRVTRRTVPNPEVTAASLEADYRRWYRDSRIDALTVERTTMGALLADGWFGSDTFCFTPDSAMWRVTMKGELPSMLMDNPVPGTSRTFVLTVESNEALSFRGD